MEKYLPAFENCLQKQDPFCRAKCPFHVDIWDFIEKLQREGYNGAYKDYKNAVGFPSIVAALCPEYCKEVCPMVEPIELRNLERATISYATNTTPPDYNLPKKKGKVAIVGAGLSGMGCALRLAIKKYEVHIFEKENQIGGSLNNLLDEAIYMDDFALQFKFEDYTLHLNEEISSTSQLEGFNAVYVATGKNGNDLGLLSHHLDKPCYVENDIGFFAGGELLGSDLMHALSDGLSMGTTIDNFLKTGNLLYTKPYEKTDCQIDESYNLSPPATKLSDQSPTGIFTKDETKSEALRCIKCQCDSCRLYCDITKFFDRWPVRIRDEIQATTLPGSSEVKATPAKRLISTCTQCGLCKEVCPENIDIGGLILEARKSMHKQEKLAWVYNEFFLRDLQFTNGDLAYIAKSPKGKNTCSFAFFPGCQLSASAPSLVEKTYESLLENNPDTGLFLSCCGVPAKWAGDDNLLDEELSKINSAWEKLGKPVLILACPTCRKHFKEHLPHIETISLYEILADNFKDINEFSINHNIKSKWSIFDPCSTRNSPKEKQSVRDLIDKTSITLEPLPVQETFSSCCSYGGHGSIANPEFAKSVIKARADEGSLPYITYCINCRDAFLSEGKEAIHILDIIFNCEPKVYTITARRENRIALKKSLLKKIWGEEMKELENKYDFNLIISDALKDKLDKEHILEEDMFSVVDFCRRTSRTVFNEETETYTGYTMIGHATYWAEYKVQGEIISKKKNIENKDDKSKDNIILVNGFSHRMKIELEGVWNGRKTEVDL